MDLNLLTLVLLFFMVALIYSSVGLGGGSSYLAILALTSISFSIFPLIALICNLLTSALGTYNYSKAGYWKFNFVYPFLLGSIPGAFLGGAIAVPKAVFLILLGIGLFLSGAILLLKNRKIMEIPNNISFYKKIGIGTLIGTFAGITGIGGGIFLSPLLMSFKIKSPKHIACTTSVFIFVNSFSGLMGQLSKAQAGIEYLTTYMPLYAAVICGGYLGSALGSSNKTAQKTIIKMTALLTLTIGSKMIFKGINELNTPKIIESRQG